MSSRVPLWMMVLVRCLTHHLCIAAPARVGPSELDEAPSWEEHTSAKAQVYIRAYCLMFLEGWRNVVFELCLRSCSTLALSLKL